MNRAYIDGFLDGQAVAYCERVRTGAGLTAQLDCPAGHEGRITALVKSEGCHCHAVLNDDRVSIWIYRDALVRRLIDSIGSGDPTPLDIWSMGKLFGYSDHSVIEFIRLQDPEAQP